ncbi:NUDIX domain-containing protein [Bacillus lacus]|uniref:8-oxo-dGTP diphosphatase n=1 Tax=Metabacillus lacus TaxID=1983721 RepID=A0A7X2J1Y6_9BACI|nr:(deoxy)nucleoside triphosphate pyrophosphohydrolase [Metabacillus lacus]MRX73983.1 NUDIX domain-containing protein [Metabacillus lacus]
MKKHIHVAGAVIVREGSILCAQRGANQLLPLLWEFPGGKIEQGEKPEDAVQREVQEEMLCKVKVGDQIVHTVHEYDFGIVHLSTYYCELIEGEPAMTEHIDMKWLKPVHLFTLNWAPADIPTVEKLAAGIIDDVD